MRRSIGKMRHKITLLSVTRTPDSGGGNKRQDVEIADVWAEIKALSDGEIYRYEKLEQSITHLIAIRYRPDVVAGMTLRFDDRKFYIQSVVRVEEKNEFLQLRVREGGPS